MRLANSRRGNNFDDGKEKRKPLNYLYERYYNGYVTCETHKGITTIEFFHPQSNSLPHRLLEELANEIHAMGTENDTKVIVLRSGGEKAFCAGASFGIIPD